MSKTTNSNYESLVSLEDFIIWRQGEKDPQTERFNELGRAGMTKAALQLPKLPTYAGKPVHLSILTGDRFWYQTAFCLWTFSKAAERTILPTIFDDGSLKVYQLDALHRIFPGLHFVSDSEAMEAIDKCLPESRYPNLRGQHRANILFKKILNMHTGQTGWRLGVDSDMLFFRSPDFLLDWCDNPSCSLHADDLMNAYGCTLDFMDSLAGEPVRRQVNSGLIGIKSDDIDWDKMEYWTKRMIPRCRNLHLFEQGLYALHLTGRECVVPDPLEYVLLPEPPEAFRCKVVMHHYVMYSKKWQVQKNWKRFVPNFDSSLG